MKCLVLIIKIVEGPDRDGLATPGEIEIPIGVRELFLKLIDISVKIVTAQKDGLQTVRL